MASEAITQNDLREILSRVTGSVPSEYKKLLWTNPSPTSAMASATIVASGADEYDAIEVVYKTAHIYNGYETALSPFVAGSHITLLAPSGTGGEFSGAIYNAVRTISMGAGGSLGVDDAVGMTSSGTSINNNMCIPYKVYGIKYERVEPPQLEADIETLATDITIIRVGNLRVLKCKSAVYSTIKSITLATSDRPPTRIEFTGIKHAGGMYATLGLGYIETTGVITAVYWGGYSGSAYPTNLVNSDNFTGDAIWYVTE